MWRRRRSWWLFLVLLLACWCLALAAQRRYQRSTEALVEEDDDDDGDDLWDDEPMRKGKKAGAAAVTSDDEEEEEDDEEEEEEEEKERQAADTKAKPASASASSVRGPISRTVFDLGLVKGKELTDQSILDYHSSYSWPQIRSRRMKGVTLGFVTPWNNHGYVIAETFGAKFTHISPVWYQVREDPNQGKLILTGGHDVDAGWIDKVRRNSTVTGSQTCTVDGDGQCGGGEDDDDDGGKQMDKPAAKIVPRLLWEINRFPMMEEVPVLVDLLSKEVKKHGFDGLCFEFPIHRAVTTKLLSQLKSRLPGAIMVVAIPSYQMPDASTALEIHLSPQDLRDIEPYVDLFPIMSYDFRGGDQGIPISPIRWVEQLVNHLAEPRSEVWRKLLVGLPFYGYRDGQPVLGRDVLEALENYKVNIQWDDISHEHMYGYVDSRGLHRMTFPSLRFLNERLDLATRLGVAGVAVWELGQGFDYFMDLL